MDQSQIDESKRILLETLSAIKQYPDYVSPITGESEQDDNLDLVHTRIEQLREYLKTDFENLQMDLGIDIDNPTNIERLERVLSEEQLNDIREIIQQYERDIENPNMSGGKKSLRKNKKSPKTCKRGMIRRRAYTRKNGSRVKASCVKDMGKPGKGKKLFTLKKGDLTKYGYSIKVGDEKRQKAHKKASKKIPYATLIRKLNVLSTLFKNTKPLYSKRAKRDMEYIRKHRTQKK